MSIAVIKKRLRGYSYKKKAALLQRFFKTGPGEYAEGDIFIGVMVPYTRKVAKEFKDTNINDVVKLLRSPVHEERLTALLILLSKYEVADEVERKKIYELYLKNYAFINNWDLVDLTAHRIIGDFLKDKDVSMLYKLALSGNLWKRRMSIIATGRYIRDNRFKETLEIAGILLNDKEDLIHKAVGWMLREVGKRDTGVLESFLESNYKRMPRTMLRYAIEKFPESKRRAYLKK